MRSRNFRFASMLVALVLALAVVPGALAQCGFSSKLIKPSSWQPSLGTAHLARTAFGDEENDRPSIVGMSSTRIYRAHSERPADSCARCTVR